jgi:hypothetical protein
MEPVSESGLVLHRVTHVAFEILWMYLNTLCFQDLFVKAEVLTWMLPVAFPCHGESTVWYLAGCAS